MSVPATCRMSAPPNQLRKLQRQLGLRTMLKWQITLIAAALRLRRHHRDLHSALYVGLHTPDKSLGQLHGYGFNATNHGRKHVRINQDVHKLIYSLGRSEDNFN